MDTLEAIQILKDHNKWRRGEIKVSPNTPTEVGQAIDLVLKRVESFIVLSN